jgi:ABC-type sugar transport system substrate-binding protein
MKIFFILLLVFFTNTSIANEKTWNITLFSAGADDSGFWGSVHDFSQTVANDLKIKLTIVYNKEGNYLSYFNSIKESLDNGPKPDAIIIVPFRTMVKQMLELTEKRQIPMMFYNTTMSKRLRQQLGEPRQKYQYYLGDVIGDDFGMGYQLANYLIEHAKITFNISNVNVVGISGSRLTLDSFSRNNGLKKAISEHNATLLQVVFASWSPEEAYQKTNTLLERHKDVHVVWAASDLMAFHANKAVKESKRVASVGGIDWSHDGLMHVASGELVASSGGHFTTAGYSLILLFDYLNGKDFNDRGQVQYVIKAGVIHQGNIEQYNKYLISKDWRKTDFKQYSKIYNPNIIHYDFYENRLID